MNSNSSIFFLEDKTMTVNERIRMIRLMEKLMANPQRAKELGIEGRIVKKTSC